MNASLTENQERILRWAASPSGPMVASGEVIVRPQDRLDVDRLIHLGLMREGHYREGVGWVCAVTKAGRKEVMGVA